MALLSKNSSKTSFPRNSPSSVKQTLESVSVISFCCFNFSITSPYTSIILKPKRFSKTVLSNHKISWKRTIFGSVFNVLSPGQYAKGRCGAGFVLKAGKSASRTGTGFLSDSGYHFYVYVLYRAESIYIRKGLRTQNRQRKSNATGIAAIF